MRLECDFDEGVAAPLTFFDSSENRGDGIGTSVTRIAGGAKGSAVTFNNVGAVVPSSFIVAKPITSSSQNITVSAWINYTDADKGQSGFIVSQNVNTLWNFFLWNSRLYWRTNNNGHDIFCPLPSGGTWHHVLELKQVQQWEIQKPHYILIVLYVLKVQVWILFYGQILIL